MLAYLCVSRPCFLHRQPEINAAFAYYPRRRICGTSPNNSKDYKMKKSTILIAAALLGSAGLTAVAAGQESAPQQKQHPSKPGKHKLRDGLPRGFDQLNLSDAQKNQIKTIMEADRPAPPSDLDSRRAEFREKMAKRREQENRLLGAKTFDEQAACQIIDERRKEREARDAEHAEHELNMLKKHHAVFQVLTPAQRKQFLDNQNRMDERRFQMIEHKPAKK